MSLELLSFPQMLGVLLAGVVTSVLALVIAARWPRLRAWPATGRQGNQPEIAFLFNEENLLDATDAARRLLDLIEPGGSDLERLTRFLSPRFPELHAQLGLGRRDARLMSSDSLSRLRLTRTGGNLRLTLRDLDGLGTRTAPDSQSLLALSDELKMYRALGDNVPFPVWRQTAQGRIAWANAMYRDLQERVGDNEPNGSLGRIFGQDFIPGHPAQRMALDLPHEAEPKWFEFQCCPLGNDLLIAAVPADRTVRAERSLSDFVQTLTQTFAHLNVGLAVFGRSRELAVFNPALTDLLGLQPEFLITHPTLFQVFDRLREMRMVPETKDYRSWRQRMSALEAAASDGTHSETWSLLDGRTFRVTGRPHPDGAVAFLFEDISSEISLERKFRAKLQLERAVIDGLDEAIAVFTPAGGLALSNRAYDALWDAGPSDGAADTSLVEASRIWQQNTAPTPVWGDARDFAATISERSNWTAEVRMRDGRPLYCRFDALPGGFTLVGFSEPAALALSPLPPSRTTLSA